jgi:quercetin dioxygenase-like cupin family protein
MAAGSLLERAGFLSPSEKGQAMKTAALSAFALTLACAVSSASVSFAQADSANPLAAARVFAYDQMPVHTAANGAENRRVFSGTLATGESVAVHETTQPAGTAPNPPHRIQHSEVIVVEQGTLEFLHDGKTERADAGSVLYVALGTLHTVRNIGDGPAKYVVIQIGGDTKK